MSNYTFKNDSFGSYIIFDKLDNIIKYQLEFIVLNSIVGLLPIIVLESKGLYTFSYNITSKQNLKDFAKGRFLTKIEFLEILSKITEIILDSKNYLLYDTCFPFDLELIFINPLTLNIMFPYIPVRKNIDPNICFKKLINDFIINHVKFEENDDKFLHKILNALKKENLTIMSFSHIIHELKHSDLALYKEKKSPQVKKLIESHETTQVFDITPYIWILLSQIVLLGFGTFLFSVLSPSNSDKFTTLLGFFIVYVVIDYFLYARIFHKMLIGISESKTTIPKTIKNTNRIQDTAILGENNNHYPILKSTKDSNEIIKINKPSFLIGRADNHVDHVFQNISIGKIHAELLQINDSYYIKDLNSKNGSYLNNNRIDSNINFELKHNDSITFANSEYVFLVPEVEDGN